MPKHFFTIISKTMPNFKGGKHYKKKAKTDADATGQPGEESDDAAE